MRRSNLALTFLLIWVLIAPVYSQEEQFRAFWVHAFSAGMKTPEQIDRLIEQVLAAHANAVVVQVSRRGDAYYNRSFQPRTEDPAVPPGFDALDYLIERAHGVEPRLEVHAWLTTLAMWNSGLGPAPRHPDHVFNQHGPAQPGYDNWFTSRYDGAIEANRDYYLDPGHPEALDYVVNMYTTVVENYDVDGIHLDRVRYPESSADRGGWPEWGYNEVAVARFQALAGRSDVPPPSDPAWMAWRRQQVSGLVRKIYLRALAVNPRVKVSAATVAWGRGPANMEAYFQTDTYRRVLQDPVGWLQEGILDIDLPMNYDREHISGERTWYRQWLEFEKDHQFGRHVVIGPALYLNSIGNSIVQIRAALAGSAQGNFARGVCGYAYQSPDRDRRPISELIRALTQPSEYDPEPTPVFATRVPTPPMLWKTAPTRGHLMGTLFVSDDPADGVAVRLVGPEERIITTDGRGWFGAADLRPGDYEVSAEDARAQVTVEAGRVAIVTLR